MNYIGNFSKTHTKVYPVSLKNVKVKGYLGDIINKNVESIYKGFESNIGELFKFYKNGTPLSDFHKRLAAESDFFKLMEGACYAYIYTQDENLKNLIYEHTEYMLSKQEEDGFILHNKERFDKNVNHDLYILGHYLEFVVAHYEAFGEDFIIKSGKKWIDTIIEAEKAGNDYFEDLCDREHPEIEVALVRFARVTKDNKYLDFAIKIIKKYIIEAELKDCKTGGGHRHVVRTNYLFMGILEAYLETGDESLFKYIEGLVNEIIDTRIYICGGGGYREAYPATAYELPQEGNIAETCGSVSLSMLLWRLFQINPNSKYLNTLERIFHNHLIGALNKEQDGIYYYNPIRSTAGSRSDFDNFKRTKLPKVHGTSCCFPNIWRFFGQLPEYIFSTGEDCIYINYLTEAEADVEIAGETIHIEVKTNFPKDGRIAVITDKPIKVLIKKPYWAENGAENTYNCGYEKGYYVSDKTTYRDLEFKFQIRLIKSNDNVLDNRGQVAVTYGPLVYMLEKPIDEIDFDDLVLDISRPMIYDKGKIKAWFMNKKDEKALYYEYKPICLDLIPFNQIGNTDDICAWSVFFKI